MKIILSSRRRHYLAMVGTFLLAIAFIVGMAGCALPADEEEEEEEFEPSLCVDFEDLTLGTQYSVGDTFTDSGVNIKVETADGITPVAEVDNKGNAGGFGQEIMLANVILNFIDLGFPCENLSLLFGEIGPPGIKQYIKINDDQETFEQFIDIDGEEIGGVNVSVVNGPNQPTGKLILSGTINSFAIGSEELVIDEVCVA